MIMLLITGEALEAARGVAVFATEAHKVLRQRRELPFLIS